MMESFTRFSTPKPSAISRSVILRNPSTKQVAIRSIWFNPNLPPGSLITDICIGNPNNSIFPSAAPISSDILSHLQYFGNIEGMFDLEVKIITMPSYEGSLHASFTEETISLPRPFIPLGIPSMKAGHVISIILSKKGRKVLEAFKDGLLVVTIPVPTGQLLPRPLGCSPYKLEGPRLLPTKKLFVDLGQSLQLLPRLQIHWTPEENPYIDLEGGDFIAVLENSDGSF